MVSAGMNAVRMGEFVWGLCEPRECEYNFDWLRRIMDLMGEEDIKVVLATPTAAPPIWLTRKHPEILPMDERGLPLCEGHPSRLLFEQRPLLGILQKDSARNVRCLGQTPAAHRLAN